MNETVESLVAFCRENDRVCPLPLLWNELWEMLPNRSQVGVGWQPPLPLILAACHHQSPLLVLRKRCGCQCHRLKGPAAKRSGRSTRSQYIEAVAPLFPAPTFATKSAHSVIRRDATFLVALGVRADKDRFLSAPAMT
jgi:hypothetical protein